LRGKETEIEKTRKKLSSGKGRTPGKEHFTSWDKGGGKRRGSQEGNFGLRRGVDVRVFQRGHVHYLDGTRLKGGGHRQRGSNVCIDEVIKKRRIHVK